MLAKWASVSTNHRWLTTAFFSAGSQLFCSEAENMTSRRYVIYWNGFGYIGTALVFIPAQKQTGELKRLLKGENI